MHCSLRVGQIDVATVKRFISEVSMTKTRITVMVYETFLVRLLFLTLSPSPSARKRRPEVMAEVIAKSKEHKLSDSVSLFARIS